jgi:ABC-type spermidine/putrescine transport system permease subunit I
VAGQELSLDPGGGRPVAAPPRRERVAAGDPSGIRSWALLAMPLGAGIVFLILPLVALTVRALSDQGAAGFVDVLGDATFTDAAGRTVLLAVAVTAICAVLGTIYALALVVAPRLLGLLLLGVLLSGFWISLLVRTFGWVLLFQPNGVLDQWLGSLGLLDGTLDLLQTTRAMYPAMIHVLLPFFVLPVYAACLRLDPELLRAGQSLGARPLSVIRHVVLPHLRAPVVAAASLVFMLSLAFYVTPLLLGGPSQLTIATLIDRQFNQQFDLGGAAVMGLLLLVVVLAIYAIVDRFVSLVPGAEEARA